MIILEIKIKFHNFRSEKFNIKKLTLVITNLLS